MFGSLRPQFRMPMLGILFTLMALSGSWLAANAQQAVTATSTNRPPVRVDRDDRARQLAAQASQQLKQKSINSALKLGLQSLAHYPDRFYSLESGSVLASAVAFIPVRSLVLTQAGDETLQFVEWSPDGTRLLSAGNSVWVWNAMTGQHQLTLTHGGGSQITDAAWDASGKRIATAATDSTVRVWDAKTGQQLLVVPTDGFQMAMLRVPGRVPQMAMQWSPSGRQIKIEGTQSTFQIVDASTGKVLLTVDKAGFGAIIDVHWNRDESEIMVASTDAVRVWDVVTGKQRISLAHPCKTEGDASWSQDESRILSWCEYNDARLWDATNGKLLMTLPADLAITQASLNKSATRIVTTGYERDEAQTWDAASGDLLLTLPQNEGDGFTVEGAQWNKDESRILTWTFGRTARVWNATSGELLLTVNYGYGIDWADWDPTGKRLLTNAGSSARVWDVATGKMVMSLDNPTSEPRTADWNADGSRIVTWATSNSIIRVWDATNGKLLFTLTHDDTGKGAS